MTQGDVNPQKQCSKCLKSGMLLLFDGGEGGLKWPGHKVEYPYPSSSKGKNKWTYASSSPICLHSVDRDSFNTTRFLDYQMLDYRILTVQQNCTERFWSQVLH